MPKVELRTQIINKRLNAAKRQWQAQIAEAIAAEAKLLVPHVTGVLRDSIQPEWELDAMGGFVYYVVAKAPYAEYQHETRLRHLKGGTFADIGEAHRAKGERQNIEENITTRNNYQMGYYHAVKQKDQLYAHLIEHRKLKYLNIAAAKVFKRYGIKDAKIIFRRQFQ